VKQPRVRNHKPCSLVVWRKPPMNFPTTVASNAYASSSAIRNHVKSDSWMSQRVFRTVRTNQTAAICDFGSETDINRSRARAESFEHSPHSHKLHPLIIPAKEPRFSMILHLISIIEHISNIQTHQSLNPNGTLLPWVDL
jgi:hypothetical protein